MPRLIQTRLYVSLTLYTHFNKNGQLKLLGQHQAVKAGLNSTLSHEKIVMYSILDFITQTQIQIAHAAFS